MLDIGGWEFLVVAFVLLMVVGAKGVAKHVARVHPRNEADS